MSISTRSAQPSSDNTLPFTVVGGLDHSFNERWDKQFVSVGRDFLESIWRRSQEQENAVESGWKSPEDSRRRMIHVMDGYSVLPEDSEKDSYRLAITDCYVWICTSLPKQEMDRYVSRLVAALQSAGWVPDYSEDVSTWVSSDLVLSYKQYDIHPEDELAGRVLPATYRTIEVTCRSLSFPVERIGSNDPWSVYRTGVRKKGVRIDKPRFVEDMKEIVPYLPARVEIGGGASLQLGIPPLNYLHTVYGLFKSDDTFAFGDDDLFWESFLADPSSFYTKKAAVPYQRALTTAPGTFYETLRKLHDAGYIRGPVITNNFDGLCSLVGLREQYVRRYDETHIVPDIDFPAGTRSLIVVGSHADRRLVQQAARNKGLQVIFVDPEEYINHDGIRIQYPLEDVHAADCIVPWDAARFARELYAAVTEGL